MEMVERRPDDHGQGPGGARERKGSAFGGSERGPRVVAQESPRGIGLGKPPAGGAQRGSGPGGFCRVASVPTRTGEEMAQRSASCGSAPDSFPAMRLNDTNFNHVTK